jgi:hypothetical protein
VTDFARVVSFLAPILLLLTILLFYNWVPNCSISRSMQKPIEGVPRGLCFYIGRAGEVRVR